MRRHWHWRDGERGSCAAGIRVEAATACSRLKTGHRAGCSRQLPAAVLMARYDTVLRPTCPKLADAFDQWYMRCRSVAQKRSLCYVCMLEFASFFFRFFLLQASQITDLPLVFVLLLGWTGLCQCHFFLLTLFLSRVKL
ncbi:hypothetical protein EDC01DRAFT_176252 [Geopyxis carbonaria]|nr:hypothetical protein EDC01DRAFT_176252 [Geopyxis carbonaria]